MADSSGGAGREVEVWREAMRARRTEAAAGAGVPAVRVGAPVGRRSLLRGTVLGGLGLAGVTAVGGLLDFLWPRNVRGFGGPVAAGTLEEIPEAGGPPREFFEGQFWLVHLDGADASENGSGGGSGLLALWKRCPHLGCSVPWAEAGKAPPGFSERAWFQCPCHGSTYTRAGVRVHGPAPRSMDTMAIAIDAEGRIVGDTGSRQAGGVDNPRRAVPAEPGARSV
ncbi:MAG: Rieske 2Fe-2S domain-containing protein [Dehalococcoidia bacterium]